MKSLLVSILCHFIVLAMLLSFKVAPSDKFFKATSETRPVQVSLKTERELYSFSGTHSRFQNSAKTLGNSSQRREKVKKLFSLAPSQSSLGSAHSSNAPTGKVYRFSGEGKSSDGGRFTYSVFGSGASHSFWTLLSRDLDERLKFIQPLYRLGEEGKISVSLDFKRDGALDESSVSSLGDQRYLKVYTLREICQAWCLANSQRADLISQSQESVKLLITVAYLSGTHERFNENPPPVVAPNKIMLERRWKTALRIGDLNLFGETDENEKTSANLSLSLEPESLISAEHRKRYGWSGAKQIQARFRALKLELEKLAEEYERRGWI